MLNPVRESNVDVVKIERVIHVYSVFGKGIESDPVRVIHEYYTLEGDLIARVDTLKSAQKSVNPTLGGEGNNILTTEEIEALDLCVGIAISEAVYGTQTDLAIEAIEKLKASQQQGSFGKEIVL